MANTFTPISPSLYVGDLLPEVSEQTLFEVFNQVGLVSNIRVCRDTNTRRSLNYAYVNYYNAGDAERALDTLNNTPIRGKPCRIMWSQRDPSLRKSGVGNVFIKNLDKGIDHKALYDTFSAFGNILSCKVVTDDNNVSKGFGFVHYESQESADKAIEKVNGMMINGQKVFVGPFKSSKERGQPTEIKFTNVFFKNLADEIDSEKLKDLLLPYGPITNITIMVDEKGKSKGFGFANFESPDSAKNCVDNENGKVMFGKPIYAGRAQKKIEREAELKHTFETKYQGVNLYIKNIDDSIDNDKLREVFNPFGTITSAIVMKDDKSSSSKGFGFVCYTSPDEATRAVTEMNGRMIGTKPLYVALAQRKDIRRAQLEMQHSQKFKSGGIRQQPMAPAYSGGPVFFTPAPGPMNPQVVYQQMMPRAPRTWNGAPVGVPQGQYPINYGVRGQPRPNGPRANGPRPNGPRPDSAQPIPAQPIETAAPAAQPAAAQTEAPLTLASLNGLPRDQQNVALGEHLYPLIQSTQPELAGKITGMLLDSLSVDELFTLTQRSDLLQEKIKEAIEVLGSA
ncbi:hypothetical protein CYY_003871 [Polysphondylium violaceum]|uniref:Polyadenylate-binding protein n=1 Tax=Polysphondylium violaceum TaxID=133409 RepID=A0A8J4V5N4_9MYCE|nr:hypothetical protein CYY_003871 [Polysphondylium violaceum]